MHCLICKQYNIFKQFHSYSYLLLKPCPLILFLGILHAQNFLSQLPQSQANLLPTQPTITLTPQVMSQRCLLLWQVFLLYWRHFTSNQAVFHLQLFIWLFCAVYNSHPHNSNCTNSIPGPQSNTTQTARHPHSGGAQWSGGTGTVCQDLQTEAHQTGLHTGLYKYCIDLYFQ